MPTTFCLLAAGSPAVWFYNAKLSTGVQMCKYFGVDFALKIRLRVFLGGSIGKFSRIRAFFFRNIFANDIFFILLYVIKQYYPT